MPRIEPFENFTDEYDAWFEENRDLYEAELRAVRRLLPGMGKGLEIGVGSGKFAYPLGIKIGVEPSGKMASRARDLGIEVLEGVAEQLPFEDSGFDYALMVTTICFVDDILNSFKEALRVLKPGGSLIVAFVDRESELGRTYEANREKSDFYRHATFFSFREVTAHMENAGFSVSDRLQALIPGQKPEIIENGCGQGAFVVIRAVRP